MSLSILCTLFIVRSSYKACNCLTLTPSLQAFLTIFSSLHLSFFLINPNHDVIQKLSIDSVTLL